MKRLLMCAPTIGVLFIFSGVGFGAFGDVVSYYEIGLDYGMYQPISLCCNDVKIWILQAKAREYEEDQYCLTIYQYKLVTTNGQNLKFERSFDIYFYGGGDMNGFC